MKRFADIPASALVRGAVIVAIPALGELVLHRGEGLSWWLLAYALLQGLCSLQAFMDQSLSAPRVTKWKPAYRNLKPETGQAVDA